MTYARRYWFRFCFVCIFCLLFSAGCEVGEKPVLATPPATVVGASEDARATERAATDSRNSWQAALLDAWVPTVSTPDGLAAFIRMLRAANPVVAPKPEHVIAAKAVVADLAAGKVEKAEGDSLKQSLTLLAAEKAASTAAREAEVKERAARIKAESDLAAERTASTAALAAKEQEITDMKAKWSRNLQLWIARGLATVGVLAIVVSGGLVWTLGLAAWKKCAGGVLFGLLLIGCGLIVGQPWFLWAAGITGAVGCAAAFFILRHARDTTVIEQGVRRAVQDGKDEAALGVGAARESYAWLTGHLAYRFPRKGTTKHPIEAVIDERLAAEGLNSRA